MGRINVKDMATAGLPAEGIYKFRVEEIDEVEKQTRAGEEYTTIEAQILLLENGDGPLPFAKRIWDNFSTDEGYIDRFTSLYKAITGHVPEGEIDDDGEFYVDTDALLDEIRGGEAYGAVIHSAKKKQDGTPRVKFGYSFAATADKVRMPKRKQSAA